MVDTSAKTPLKGATLAPRTRRIINASADISEASPHEFDYLHTIMCQVGLPRSRVKERVFERRNGNASLILQAGSLWVRGAWQEQPLPYGPHPRLVMIYVSTEAVRSKNRVVEVGNSTHEFLTRLGISTGGGPRGGYSTFKRHMQALAACHLTICYSVGDRDVTIFGKPVQRFEAWIQHDEKQIALWPGVMELSQEFYESLSEHAIPLDPRALAALKHSALALDVYSWLAHRLCRVRQHEGVMLSWKNLMEQFGQEYNDPKNFRRKFLAALRQVRPVYPDAKLNLVRGGLRLYSSPPPIPKSQIVVELPPERSKYYP